LRRRRFRSRRSGGGEALSRNVWRSLLIVLGLLLANGALLAVIGLAVGLQPGQSPTPPPTVALPPPTPSPLPVAQAAPSPTASPLPFIAPTRLPTLAPARPVPGELPLNTAILSFVPEGGLPATVDRLQASCGQVGDSLGLIGSYLGGPLVARYQITIAPFRGSGTYRNTADSAEIGGSVSISGALQMFVGPPYDAVAEVVRDGALGRLSFTGPGVDGRRGSGVLRWECGSVSRR
jgi:hypothetical protein